MYIRVHVLYVLQKRTLPGPVQSFTDEQATFFFFVEVNYRRRKIVITIRSLKDSNSA